MSSQPLWVNALLFGLAAVCIWWAGTRLERQADEVSRRTGLGDAFIGLVLLAVATSLPEVVTTVTAIVVLDNPELALHNLLGGVALQTTLLVVADRLTPKRGALTYFTPRFALLTQGVGLVLLLQIANAGIAAKGTPLVAGVSAWSVLLFVSFLLVMYLTYRYRSQPRWTPSTHDDVPMEERAAAPGDGHAIEEGPYAKKSSKRLALAITGACGVVLAGGWLAASTADTLAAQTGLGPVFLGATLLALATSLPEVSTTVTAVRRRKHTMAMSNIFGSNIVDVSLIVLADVLYREGSILAHAQLTVIFVAAVGAAMTCIYLWGLMEHENRVAFGVGWDSAAVISLYVGAMAVLYVMQ
jgi:cation:H+ antiporter